jgi:predicted Co/Zn/Cd cation transporter (cation efflux family)
VLVVIRLIIDLLNYDVLTLTTLVTAFIGGCNIHGCDHLHRTLTDYRRVRRSERDCGCAPCLHQDSRLFRPPESPASVRLREHIHLLSTTIVDNFRTNTYDNEKVRAGIARINDDLYCLVDQNAPPQFIAKIRTGLGDVDRLTSRVKTIAETSFIPAAYAIAEISVAGVILVLFFVHLDSVYEAAVLFSIITGLLISILLLIKDMDNPFEYGQKTFADVDLSPLLELERYLK